MTLADLISWGAAPRQARRIGEEWERKGWLAQDPNHKNARFVTDILRRLAAG
jgi:hypothetical protein